ncbi:PH domain-containing protein [Methanobrevibacter arboriphilus]|uniref:PH domain-containing protein n=1 Tax=Methanobrevibacter arboriphilus TaxID=39441 RepID=UPI0021E62A02|nr:PH domain-containing protein [Methanobrevibacter arboriphilus]
MPYSKIQDIVISQGILGRIVSVGTVTAYSGYDESKLEISNVSNPKLVEETIFF